MRRIHITVIAFLLAVAAILGSAAALRTVQLGAAARPRVSDAAIAQRSHRLDRLEAQLRREARRRPPAVGAVGASQPRTVYVRPQPIVRVLRRTGDDQHEREGERDD